METTELPDDLAHCHEIIRQQADTIRESQRRIEQLEHQVELLLRRQFGPRRESVDPAQLRLFTDDAPDDQRIAEVVALVAEQGGLEYARRRGDQFAREAEEALAELPESVFRTALVDAIGYVLDRRW